MQPTNTNEALFEALLTDRDRVEEHIRQWMAEDGIFVIVVSLRVPIRMLPQRTLAWLHRRIVTELSAVVSTSLASETLNTQAGPVALFMVRGGAREAKLLAIAYEQLGIFGQFCDADIRCPDPISRHDLGLPLRPCFVCDRPAKECIVLRRHDRMRMRVALYFQILVSLIRNRARLLRTFPITLGVCYERITTPGQ